ncbi:hypothetical protein AB205_0116880 [Aquarana catesbeiana]|uniref:Uncharacterized protein n=1 Tax=Aquarana catesbeiana TaxID=8400 RepID=A0A2G9P2N1_AQUCT|nr:hypothetical protein AB205_0116880 [Aquarana catesbeiana]
MRGTLCVGFVYTRSEIPTMDFVVRKFYRLLSNFVCRKIRWKMCDGAHTRSEFPTTRLHQTVSIGISVAQNLRSGSKIFRQQNPFKQIPIRCTQFRCTKCHACSESSRREALAIELHFSWLVVRVVHHRVLDVRNFRPTLCDRVYARQV